MLATTLHSLSLPLGIGAAVALVGWCALLGLVLVATRPHRPEPVSTGLELGGDSPPAVAGMLTHRWKPGPIGVAATLVDLAARKVVRFEPISGGGYQLRMSDEPSPVDLIPHEAHVLSLIRDKAERGVVPCAALQLPDDKATTNWFRTFDALVASEARRRGLSRARFSATVISFVGASSAVVAALVGIAVAAILDTPPARNCTKCSSGSDSPWVIVLFVGVCTWFGLIALFRRFSDERDTSAGLAEAGRWLGLRDNLREDTVFCMQHVDAVTVWDRLLAFGVGLGVAHVAAHDLPIGAESKHEAWSAESGTWRLVRISYPEHLPPGYGDPTWICLVKGLFQLAVAAFVLVMGVPLVSELSRDIARHNTGLTGIRGALVGAGLGLAAAIVGVAAILVGLRAAAILWFASNDLFSTRVVEGRVLRSSVEQRSSSRSHEVWEAAVDDGTSDHLRAWRGVGPLPPLLQEGNRVRATITRNLCTIRSVELLPDQSDPAGR